MAKKIYKSIVTFEFLHGEPDFTKKLSVDSILYEIREKSLSGNRMKITEINIPLDDEEAKKAAKKFDAEWLLDY